MALLLGYPEQRSCSVREPSFFYGQYSNGDTQHLGQIIRSGNPTVSINLFRPPLPEDNIALLTYSRLQDTIQVIQTTKIVDIDADAIFEVSFVIPYVQLLDDCHLLEVSGMELVRVLHERLCNGCFEEICTPTFPSNYDQFYDFYHLNDDVSCNKWVEDWFDCGDVIKWLKPEDWYLGGHQWNNCIIPRLMTAHWQKLMSKICDLMFTVPVGSDVWDDSQFEPLVVGLCFPLSRNSPWKLKGTPVLDGVERLLRTLPLSDRGWGRSILRKLFKQTRSLDRMPASLVREMLQATR